jgi:hypothetical protein
MIDQESDFAGEREHLSWKKAIELNVQHLSTDQHYVNKLGGR